MPLSKAWSALSRYRGELALLGGSVAAFLALLVGGEGIARRADPRYLDRTGGPTVYSESLGWRLRPGFRGLVHDVWTTVNSHGQRGAEHSEWPPPGRRRIVLLGDSIAFGHRVLDEQTFASLLEARSGRFDVVNLAVEGYGTDQELIQLRESGLRWHPAVVVLGFCLHNDVLNNSLRWDHQDGRTPKPWFELEGSTLRLHDEHLRLSPPRRVAQWLRDESHLYGRVAEWIPPGPVPPAVPGSVSDKPTATLLTFQLVREIAALTDAADARFIVLLLPDEPAMSRGRPLARRFAEEPSLSGIATLNLAERWLARGLRADDVLLDHQGHLTPLGHELVAREIETELGS